jgi:hypothetical protein
VYSITGSDGGRPLRLSSVPDAWTTASALAASAATSAGPPALERSSPAMDGEARDARLHDRQELRVPRHQQEPGLRRHRRQHAPRLVRRDEADRRDARTPQQVRDLPLPVHEGDHEISRADPGPRGLAALDRVDRRGLDRGGPADLLGDQPGIAHRRALIAPPAACWYSEIQARANR